MYHPIIDYTQEWAGEFVVYDRTTARNVIIGSTNGQTWTSYANSFPASGSGRNQPVWMRSRARFAIPSTKGAGGAELLCTDDKNATTPWTQLSNLPTVATADGIIYNPDADRLVTYGSPAAAGHPVDYSDDGGATWSSADYGSSGTLTRSFGSWSRSIGKYVFCDSTCNIAAQNQLFYSTDGSAWTINSTGMNSEFGGGFATIRYSKTYDKYMSVGAGGNGGNSKNWYSSTTGTSFTATTISSDNVAWWDCIEVSGVIISVAGQSVVPSGTTSNLCARSTNGGTSFTVAASMPASRDWSYLAYNGNVIACVAATAAKVAVTTDLGQSWTEYSLPNTATQFVIGAFFTTPV